jgi:hypothetical protein
LRNDLYIFGHEPDKPAAVPETDRGVTGSSSLGDVVGHPVRIKDKGIRLGELVSLRVGDIDLAEGRCRVVGKGVIPMSSVIPT